MSKKLELNPEMLDRISRYVKFYYYKFKLAEPIDDIYQEVILQLITTNYLSRYDETRSLHKYLSGFVFNIFCSQYNKEKKKESLFVSLDIEVNSETETCLSAMLVDDNSIVGNNYTEHWAEVTKVLNDLVEDKCSTYIIYNKDLSEVIGIFEVGKEAPKVNIEEVVILKRDLLTVFILLYVGYNKAEIARLLNVSLSWVSKISKRLEKYFERK